MSPYVFLAAMTLLSLGIGTFIYLYENPSNLDTIDILQTGMYFFIIAFTTAMVVMLPTILLLFTGS